MKYRYMCIHIFLISNYLYIYIYICFIEKKLNYFLKGRPNKNKSLLYTNNKNIIYCMTFSNCKPNNKR